MSNRRLGVVETGNEVYIKYVVVAPVANPSAASTAVSFSRMNPDGTTDTATSPTAAITGPTAGTEVVEGVSCTTTTWHWRTPLFSQKGRSIIRARSTAGLLCSDDSDITTPDYAPLGP